MARKKKKPNPIDTGVEKVRSLKDKTVQTVKGSKEVQKMTGKAKDVAAKAKEKMPGAKKKAAEVKQKAKQTADTAKKKVGLKTSAAARANESIKKRDAGPQPEKKPEYKRTGPADVGRSKTGTYSRADAEKAFQRSQEPPKQSMRQRATAKTLRTASPYAAAAMIEPAIGYAADVSQYGGAKGTEMAGEDAMRTLRAAPGAVRQFGSDVVNDPLGTAGDVAIGAGDLAFNTGTAIGDASRALFQEGNFGENYRKNREMTEQVLNNPFSRFFKGDGTEQQQPTGDAADAAMAQPPATQPGETGPATKQQRSDGLGAAMNNREFLADKAKGFRTGFDVLKDAAHTRTGGIGDVAAYNAATGIARRGNQAERAGREMNIAEAEARSNIEAQTSQNMLNMSKAQKNAVGNDMDAYKRLQETGKRSNEISTKWADLQRQADSPVFGQDKVALDEMDRMLSTSVNQMLESNFDPYNPDAVFASNMIRQEIMPLMSKGIIEGISNAAVSSGFDLADILNDNGELAINKKTMDRMVLTQDDDGDMIFSMDVSKQGKNGAENEVIPLFFADEIENPLIRDQLTRITGDSSATRTLSNVR